MSPKERVRHRLYMRRYLSNPINRKRHQLLIHARLVKAKIAILKDRANKTKMCLCCKRRQPFYEFRLIRGIHIGHICTRCRSRQNALWKRKRGKEYIKRISKLYRLTRKDPKHRARWVLCDCRNSDRKNKLENDLDIDFVNGVLSNGCSYCGDKSIKITLDRINNARGHMRNNVVSACVRCNYIRKDMPYNIWLEIVPSIRKAQKNGLFTNWKGYWCYDGGFGHAASPLRSKRSV